MQLMNIVELIQDEFPQYGQSYIGFLFNNIYEKFCRKTRIIKRDVTIMSTDSAWSFSDNEATISLKSKNISSVEGLVFKDASNHVLWDVCEYKIDGDNLILTFRLPLATPIIGIDGSHQWVDNNGNVIVDSGGTAIIFINTFSTLTISAVLMPKRLININDVTEIEDEFVEGIIAGVKERLYIKAKDIQSAAYWKNVYKETELEGMRLGNSGKDGLPIQVKYQFL